MKNKLTNIIQNRYGRIMIFSIVILVSATASYSITTLLLRKNNNNAKTLKPVGVNETVSDLTTSSTDTQSVRPQTTAPSTQPATQSVTPTQQNSQSTQTTTTIYCGVKGMPEGVCNAIAAIEKSGLKNSPYVAPDTTSVPDNTKITIDRLSWQQNADTTSNVKFTAITGTSTFKGSATFSDSNGTWKVVGFSLAN